MRLVLNPALIICVIAGAVLLFFVGRLLITPKRFVLGLLFNSVLGAAALTGINAVGSAFSFHIPVNILNSFITGILGVPGVFLILAVNLTG